MIQKGTHLRLVGQTRPSSWENARGVTKYGIEFVVTGRGVSKSSPAAGRADVEPPQPETGSTGASGKSRKKAA